MGFILVYVTFPNDSSCRSVVSSLIEKKLVVCANIFPVSSVFLWDNQVKNDFEVVSILKVKKNNWFLLKKEIECVHPYDVPCIIKLNVESNEVFDDWINSF